MPENNRREPASEVLDCPETEQTESGLTDLDIESLVVAHYVVNLDMSYKDLERMMGLSHATVARRLQHARTREWLVPAKLQLSPELERILRHKVHCVDLQDRLRGLLSRYGLRQATVVDDTRVMDESAYEVSVRMGQAAAARLLEVLGKRKRTSEPNQYVIGVNWGHSTRWTIEHCPRQDSDNRDLVFVPLIGNLSVDERHEKEYEEAWLCSANRLARLAAEQFRTGNQRRLATPAIIPSRFLRNKQKLETIWEMIECDASYRAIFGEGYHQGKGRQEDTFIARMDTVITGMSALEPTSAIVDMAHLVGDEELSALKDAGFVGDIGGRLIDDPENPVTDPAARDRANSLGDLVVSAEPRDFAEVARRARDDEPWKGVFMIGRGPQKAPALIAACRMRAVTELFTDRSTAEAMIEILDPEATQNTAGK